MGRKRRTNRRKVNVIGSTEKLRSVTDVKLAGDLMLSGHKLINSYFSKDLNKPVFCFADTMELSKKIARIRENRIINGYIYQ